MRTQKKVGHSDELRVVGADANNLKFIDVTLPSPGVTLLTGASGSGKTSLLKDTLAVEADRRREIFLGLGATENGFAGAWIGPTPPSVHVGQRSFQASVRTTVATATGMLAYIRRLFVRHSHPWADLLNELVPEPSARDWASWIAVHWKGEVEVWAAPVRHQETDGMRAVALMRAHGIDEVIVRSETDRPSTFDTGRTVATASFKGLDRRVKHTIEARVGKMRVEGRRDESVLVGILETAFAASNGCVVVELVGSTDPVVQGPFGPRLDSTLHLLHPACATVFQKPSRHLLSFNAPEHAESGACRRCRGTGRSRSLKLDALVTHPERSMNDGAFSLWSEKNYKYVNVQHSTIEGLSGLQGFDPRKPWKSLRESARKIVIDGTNELVADRDPESGKPLSTPRPFEGFRKAILRRVENGSEATSARLAHLIDEGPCDDCGGTRWSPQARALRVGGFTLEAMLGATFDELPSLLHSADADTPPSVSRMLRTVAEVASNLAAVGLGHLSGNRGMTEVSAGESRRLRLAGILNAPVEGLLVLLDEPARGLHENDVAGLARAIRRLSSSHTIVISDHRSGLLPAVDHVIDMGEKSGPSAGSVCYAGPPKKVLASRRTRDEIRDRSDRGARLSVRSAWIHNLEGVDVELPIGRLTCITGLSGSGKSSFVRGALVPELARSLPPERVMIEDFELRTGGRCTVKGIDAVRSLVALDQSTPPMNRRSLVLTFLDMAKDVRDAFAASPAAKRLGLDAADFGLNSGVGRCNRCLGLGEIEDDSRWVRCPMCGGLRYGPEALTVEVERMSLGRLLASSIAEIVASPPPFLAAHLALLETVQELGLGHLSLGRRVDSLSGGETQRLRIARVLTRDADDGIMFVLDEPAAGLHAVDVERLGVAFKRMLSGGNTVVLVEHNPSLIAMADHIVEFGPGSGPRGGKVVASGTPAHVARTATETGRMLKSGAKQNMPFPRPTKATIQERTLDGAQDARNWIRLLIGDDVEPPEPDGEPRRPGVVPSTLKTEFGGLLETGHLDEELATFLVEVIRSPDDGTDEAEFIETWNRHPTAELRILPFIDEIRMWGARLPRGVASSVRRHVAALGLTLDEKSLGGTPWIRAGGGRLVPLSDTAESRRGALRDALAIGAGYVELVEKSGAVIAIGAKRLIDIRGGLVGPLQPIPGHLLRRSSLGACRMCSGNGRVLHFDASLVIGNRNAAPASTGWLRTEALNVLRGTLRNELSPFLKRLSDEGLFDLATPFGRLKDPEREWLLHGFWRRPGPGTFLKPKKDPSEVAGWLRWDGLFRRLGSEVDRSRDAAWRLKLEKSRSFESCPSCRGSGLSEMSELVKLGDKSLRELTLGGTIDDLYSRILSAPKVSGGRAQRHEERRRRLLECLRPAIADRIPFGAAVAHPPAIVRGVLKRAVSSFTTMELVEDPDASDLPSLRAPL